MKKLILWGLAGILGILLVQSPLDLQAMDSGIVGYEGYHGYHMGPEMMGHGGHQPYAMGPSTMRPSAENGSQAHQNRLSLDNQAAERIFKDYLKSKNNPNLKLGKITDQGYFYEAALLTKDNSLVDELILDKNTGRIHSAYSEIS
jgi:hypothetical protein